MKKKSNKLEFILLLIFIIALGILIYFYFYKNIGTKDDFSATKVGEIKANKEYENQKSNVISALSSLNKYGDWPEIPYQLSGSRGNPFQEKTQSDSTVNN